MSDRTETNVGQNGYGGEWNGDGRQTKRQWTSNEITMDIRQNNDGHQTKQQQMSNGTNCNETAQIMMKLHKLWRNDTNCDRTARTVTERYEL
jgi:hypothetical protein